MILCNPVPTSWNFFRLNVFCLSANISFYIHKSTRQEDMSLSLTFVQKALAINIGAKSVVPGQIIEASPDGAMSHENAGLVIKQFKEMGAEKVFDREKIHIIFDHRVPANTDKTAEGQATVRRFVTEQGIRRFHDVGDGVCHQVMVENHYIKPGLVYVGTDSHTTSYGALSAFSTGIGATEMAAVWATGKIWLRGPETLRLILHGKFPKGVYAKDLILQIIGDVTAEGANYMAVEFDGEAMERMSISERFTLCNLSMEMGAKSAVCPPNKILQDYLGKDYVDAPWSDPDAGFAGTREYDLAKLVPVVSAPHQVDNVQPVTALAGLEINQVFLGSCTNGREDDLSIAAKIVKGKRIHPRVRLIIAPASRKVMLDSIASGDLAELIRAGGTIITPGCGPCLGAHQGLLAAGERALATSNRNFKGRMGSPDAEVYLGSPATAAVSALTGVITDPREYVK